MPPQSLIVIPARLQSTRLPRKLLLNETGKTLIEHTYRAAQSSRKATAVVVGTDSDEIVDAVSAFGGKAVLTRADHPSGTDRVAEVAADYPDCEIVVNVQGDEPELPGTAIDLAIELLESDSRAVMATLAAPIRERSKLEDPNCVKVVVDQDQRALYFSRSAIPHPREWSDERLNQEPACFLQHIGLYAYRRDFLLSISTLPMAEIEKIESLEQLRVLHAGHSIAVGIIDHPVVGIDTAEDYAAFVRRQAS